MPLHPAAIVANPTTPTKLDTSQRIFEPVHAVLTNTTTFGTTSGTLYAAYLGLLNTAQAFAFVRLYVSTASTGTQTAEVGLLSSPAAPNGTAQTLTGVVASSLGSTLLTGLVTNSTTMAGTTIAAGTHLWVGIRVAMTTSQPTFSGGLSGDWGRGAILTRASSAAIAAGTTYAMSVPSAVILTSNQAPRMVVTLD